MARPRADEERILQAARRVLERDGWQAASAERIATEAGVSRVTLHRHGLTREVILGQLGEFATERYRETMGPILTAPQPADERLSRALEAICELAEQNLALLLALDAQANATVFHENLEATETLTRDVFTEPLERMLRDGAHEASLRPFEDPLRQATVIFNMAGWTYVHLRSGHNWSPVSACEATVQLILGGVRSG